MAEIESEILKECSRCHRMLPLSAFYKQNGRKYGVRSNCKECVFISNHSEERKKKLDEWRKKYYEENKEILSLKRKDYAERTKEERKEKSKIYREQHIEEIKRKDKEYYETHGEERKLYAKNWRNNNKELCQKYAIDSRERIKDVVYSFKKPCEKCGEKRLYLIQFHHIDPNDKVSEVRTAGTKESRIEEIKKCVCLCANCHIEFHHFYGNNPENPVESLIEYLGKGDMENV